MHNSPFTKDTSHHNLHISDWDHLDDFKTQLEEGILPAYLSKCRWFRSKTKSIKEIHITTYPLIPDFGNFEHQFSSYLLRIHAKYQDDSTESYFMPITLIMEQEQINHYSDSHPQAIVSEAKIGTEEGIVVDALYEERFRKNLFEALQNGTAISNANGTIQCETGKVLLENRIPYEEIYSKVLNADQSNTSIIYNDQYFLKIYRKLEYGINPDLELVRFLSERSAFENSPQYGGSIQFTAENNPPIVLGLLQNKILNRGDAWTTMLEDLDAYYERVLALEDKKAPKLVQKDRLYFMDVPQKVRSLIGRSTYQRVTLLAKRTAEMHIALAGDQEEDSFIPCDFCQEDQDALYKAQANLVEEQLTALHGHLHSFPQQIVEESLKVINQKAKILDILQTITQQPISATQTRVHGDYHLGQVLDDGKDFYIIDFEGEPMRSIEERRVKTSPFKDVAGMVRSFHYAAYGELYLHPEKYEHANIGELENWAVQWFHYVCRFYLTAYFDRVENQSFIPDDKAQLDLLLRTFILEKAIYEVGYEMNARPDWLRIPLRGILYEMQD